ncbi:MAG: hypothetical protein AAFZ15_16995 [Bacteroidota bacterium]
MLAIIFSLLLVRLAIAMLRPRQINPTTNSDFSLNTEMSFLKRMTSL